MRSPVHLLAASLWLFAGCDKIDSPPAIASRTSVTLAMNQSSEAPWGPQYLVKNANASGKNGDSVTVEVYPSSLVAQWNVPPNRNTSVDLYPEVICGHKPWEPEKTPGSLIPAGVQSCDLAFSAQYVRSDQRPGRTDTALDVFFGRPSGGLLEVMVWTETTRQLGTPFKTNVAIGGRFFDLIGWESGDGNQFWSAWAWVDRSPTMSGPVQFPSLLAFLDALAGVGAVAPQDLASLEFASVEFGEEILDGAGTLTISDLQIKVVSGVSVNVPAQPGQRLCLSRVGTGFRCWYGTWDLDRERTLMLAPGIYHAALFNPSQNSWSQETIRELLGALGATTVTWSGRDVDRSGIVASVNGEQTQFVVSGSE